MFRRKPLKIAELRCVILAVSAMIIPYENSAAQNAERFDPDVSIVGNWKSILMVDNLPHQSLPR